MPLEIHTPCRSMLQASSLLQSELPTASAGISEEDVPFKPRPQPADLPADEASTLI